MSEQDSLILAGKRQMDLIPSSQLPDAMFEFQEAPGVGEFTGERFFAREPEKYRMVLSMLAEGIGVARIATVLRVSVHTVIGVRDREGVPIATEKKRLAGLAHNVAGMLLEGALEDVANPEKRAKIPTRDKVLAAAIAIDKGQLLAGQATWRGVVEEVAAPEHEDFNAYIQTLKSAGPEIRLEGGKARQKEVAAGTEPRPSERASERASEPERGADQGGTDAGSEGNGGIGR